MKVAFVIEYFPPFAAGGSEWSTYYLAKDLARNGTSVVVLTPNYGSKKSEKIENVRVIRFPFYLKLKDVNKLPGNFALTNPLWTVWNTLSLIYFIKKEKPDVIHVQGKYSVPSTVLANLLFRKPLIATIRDYQIICNYGICLTDNKMACNLKNYFFSDFRQYFNIYVKNKNLRSIFLNLIYAIWGRFSKNYLKYFVNKADLIISLSKKQKLILRKNGITPHIESISTNYVFNNITFLKKNKKYIVFVGRLTPGKGIGLFLEAIPIVKKTLKDLKIVIIGLGMYKEKVEALAQIDHNITYIPFVNHQKLQKHLEKGLLVVVPSLWQDPLPRVAMEAISNGTPVIATNSGGLPEIIHNDIYGYICKRTPNDLASKIILGVENEKRLRKNIQNDFNKLSYEFGLKLVLRYIKIYESLINEK